MTRPLQEVEHVARLLDEGLNAVEASRESGVPWRTIQKWRQRGMESIIERRARRGSCDGLRCDRIDRLPPGAYAYLLGQYLGDGSIVRVRRTFRLEVTSDRRYPGIISEVLLAMRAVLPESIASWRMKVGCVAITSYSNHWPCLFPQHGPPPKHERPIELTAWQRPIVERETEAFLRGLIHSDGCRVLNRVKGTDYPRYHFSNRSDDIRGLFMWACSLAGVECRPNNRWTLSVARRASVARMDEFVGPKR